MAWADGGTETRTAALLESLLRRGANVKEYGATGDGSTDDTTAIAAAIADAEDYVWFPAGTYVVSSQLSVPIGISVIGAGSQHVTISHTANGQCFSATAYGSFSENGQTFRGLTVSGNSGASAVGIVLGDGYGQVLDDVEVVNYTGGIGVRLWNYLNWTEGVSIRNSRIKNCARGLCFHRNAGSGGTNSFGYTNIRGLSINVPASGVGIEMGNPTGTDDVWIYNSRLECVFWLATGATGISLPTQYGSFEGQVFITGEPESSATSTTLLDNEGGFAYNGQFQVTPDTFTTTFGGSNAPYKYTNVPVGTETSVIPGIQAGDFADQIHAGIGLVQGANLAYPVMWGYSYSGSPVLRVAARPYTGNVNTAWDADANTVFEVTADGDVATSGTITSGGTSVVLDNDSRLTDTRTPTDGSVTAAKVGSNQRFDLEGLDVTDATDSATNANSVKITPSGNKSASTSTGGALNITNTGSTGAGVVIYTALGATAAGRAFVVRVNNTANPQQAAYIEYNGTNSALVVSNLATSGAASAAATFTSTNPGATAVGINGYADSWGVVKVTHNKSGTDTNASAISLLLNGTGTACQGIFLDTESGVTTTGKLINFRQNGTEVFVVTAAGNIEAAGTITSGGDTVLTERSETFSISGDVATMTGAHRLYLKNGGTIAQVRASVGTAPTGASLIVDVNRNGTTIYGTQANRPTIAASGNTATGGAASNGTFSAGDYLTVDVDQVGSTVAGADLTVTVWWTE